MTTPADIKAIIQQQLPNIIAEDPTIRDFILRTVSEYYSPKQESDRKFDEFTARVDRILDKLDQNEKIQAQKWEENNRKWEENNRRLDEQNRRLDEFIREQNHKWEENNHKWNLQYQQNQETLAEIRKMNQKHESTIGALGSRWGLYSEASFRNALAGILQESFDVEVMNLNDYDPDGIVFGRSDQVEIDVIIKNGLVILCEIKSSIDKGGMYIFDRKVEFYRQKYQREVNRKIVISPMVADNAFPVAKDLDIEVYSYADSVSL